MRVEETSRGLSVTHIVPGGQGEKGGLKVLDVMKTVDGKQVSKLKHLAEVVKGANGEIAFEITVRVQYFYTHAMHLHSSSDPYG